MATSSYTNHSEAFKLPRGRKVNNFVLRTIRSRFLVSNSSQRTVKYLPAELKSAHTPYINGSARLTQPRYGKLSSRSTGWPPQGCPQAWVAQHFLEVSYRATGDFVLPHNWILQLVCDSALSLKTWNDRVGSLKSMWIAYSADLHVPLYLYICTHLEPRSTLDSIQGFCEAKYLAITQFPGHRSSNGMPHNMTRSRPMRFVTRSMTMHQRIAGFRGFCYTQLSEPILLMKNNRSFK